jgi:hypothetical protein
MTRWMSALFLGACSGSVELPSLPIGEDNAAKPEPKPIEAPPAALELHVTNSLISVSVVKDGDVQVPGKLGGAGGILTFADGAALQGLAGSFTIPVSSWDSGLELRDTRVEDIFFEKALHPEMSYRLVSLDGLPPEPVAVGGSVEGTAVGRLTVGGTSIDTSAKVKLSRLTATDFSLDTVEPFYVSIDAIGRKNPLLLLIKECNHKSIDDNVQVSVRLELGPQPPAAAAPPPPADASTDDKPPVRSIPIQRGPERASPSVTKVYGGGNSPDGDGKAGKAKGGKAKGGKAKGKGGKND